MKKFRITKDLLKQLICVDYTCGDEQCEMAVYVGEADAEVLAKKRSAMGLDWPDRYRAAYSNLVEAIRKAEHVEEAGVFSESKIGITRIWAPRRADVEDIEGIIDYNASSCGNRNVWGKSGKEQPVYVCYSYKGQKDREYLKVTADDPIYYFAASFIPEPGRPLTGEAPEDWSVYTQNLLAVKSTILARLEKKIEQEELDALGILGYIPVTEGAAAL